MNRHSRWKAQGENGCDRQEGMKRGALGWGAVVVVKNSGVRLRSLDLTLRAMGSRGVSQAGSEVSQLFTCGRIHRASNSLHSLERPRSPSSEAGRPPPSLQLPGRCTGPTCPALLQAPATV